MSQTANHLGTPGTPLRDPNDAKRHVDRERHGIGPWNATVRIVAYRWPGETGTFRLQIEATWTGPPLPGSPAAAPGQAVTATDVVVLSKPDLEHAFRVYAAAEIRLARGQVPDLRALAESPV